MKESRPSIQSITRRKLIVFAAATTAMMSAPISAFAQKEDGDIVLGASVPITGPFAFAGIGVSAGIQDYMTIINDSGGVNGRKVRYVAEDTGYKVDASVAAFNKITDQNEVHVYYGDSTGFAKTIYPEVERRGSIMMGGASFASELNDSEKYPLQFMAGPDYSEMVGILLRYIAKKQPGADVAFINSDTEFGRDPLEHGATLAKELKLNVVAQIVTPPSSVDVSTELLKLRRANPDYTIFHGFVLAPIPEFIQQAKELGMKSRFMGTFWSMDKLTVQRMGDAADGFMGVMPYRYYDDTEGKAPMLDKIRELQPDYQSVAYTQGFLTAMLMMEAIKRTLDADQPLTGENIKTSLNTLEDYDTGGIFGVPITIKGNSIPVGRIYQYSAESQKMVPESDWIELEV